jgi:hypothetical protein
VGSARDQLVLELSLALVEQRDGQTGASAEPVKERALGDPGSRCDLLELDVVEAVLANELASGPQDAHSVAGGVRALGRGTCKRQLPVFVHRRHE